MPTTPAATYALERGFLAMSTQDAQDAVAKAFWGYDDRGLRMDELKSALTGEFGTTAARLFSTAMSRGFASNYGGTLIRSFAANCARGRLDLLEEVVSLPGVVNPAGVPLSKSDWLDQLCTRETEHSRPVFFSMYAMAAQSINGPRTLFEIALRHQPDHPDIQCVLDKGGESAAILAEMLIERRLTAGATSPDGQATKLGANDSAGARSRPRRSL